MRINFGGSGLTRFRCYTSLTCFICFRCFRYCTWFERFRCRLAMCCIHCGQTLENWFRFAIPVEAKTPQNPILSWVSRYMARTFFVRSFRIEWDSRRRISRNFDFRAKIAKLALGAFEFQYGACGLHMGISPKNVRTQFWDARQLLWKSVDIVDMF